MLIPFTDIDGKVVYVSDEHVIMLDKKIIYGRYGGDDRETTRIIMSNRTVIELDDAIDLVAQQLNDLEEI